MSTYYTSGVGVAPQGVSINNNRWLYNFGDAISNLNIQDALYFAYLSKMRKRPTNSPVFKMLEQRHQWHRRRFEVETSMTSVSIADPTTLTDLQVTCHVDKYGRTVTADTAPRWLLPKQRITFEVELNDGPGATYIAHRAVGRITAVGTATSTYVPITVQIQSIDNDTDYATTYSGDTLRAVDGKRGRVMGSAFAEGTNAPDGWYDFLYDREGYTQIFKTSVPVISGSTMATEYRGIRSEWGRIWSPKLAEHKNDITEALLFGVGKYEAEDGTDDPKRFTWGTLPYIEQYGETQNFSYGATEYDDFMDWLESFMHPRKGGSRVRVGWASRKILSWFSKLGDNQFLSNSVGRNAYQIQVTTVNATFFPGTNFGQHEVVVVRTPFGRIALMEEVMLDEMFEDYAFVVDMDHIEYRPLVGNGMSRDTFSESHIETPGTDGRKDQILTEAGLWIGMPELHSVLHFQ